eukprot:835579-Pyramimonas_sp.AAC.1
MACTARVDPHAAAAKEKQPCRVRNSDSAVAAMALSHGAAIGRRARKGRGASRRRRDGTTHPYGIDPLAQ